MAVKIAVTEPEYRKAAAVFAQASEHGFECIPLPSEEAGLADALRQERIEHVIVGVVPYRAALYETLHPGSVIARFGVGHDGIDKPLATNRGLLCTNTPGVLDDSVAEHTVGLILALARHTPQQMARLIGGEWSSQVGVELAGKRLAVLGCGGIGRRVACIAARGFGMTVVGLRQTQGSSGDLQEQYGFRRMVTDYHEAIDGADFVSLHLPATSETKQYLNRSRLSDLPVGCRLINTARGMLIDEVALFEALSRGRIAGAALDVFEKEPYQPPAPEMDLRRLPNVIMTPHTGSSTREACDRMAHRALRNIQLAAAGSFGEMDLLNPSVLQRPHLNQTTRPRDQRPEERR